MTNAFQSDAFQDGAWQEASGGIIALPLLDAGGALYAPTFAVGAVAIVLPLLDASRAVYDPVVIPTMTSPVRVSQVAAEVLLTSTDGDGRVTQVALEVLRRTNAEGGPQVIIVGL